MTIEVSEYERRIISHVLALFVIGIEPSVRSEEQLEAARNLIVRLVDAGDCGTGEGKG